jgi:hypothetical protein
MSEIRISKNYFPNGNLWTESTSPWTASGAGPRWITVTVPGRLAGERPEWRPHARNLTAVEEKWRGDGGEPHRLQEGATEGQTRPGDGGERSVEEALGGVGTVDSEASD